MNIASSVKAPVDFSQLNPKEFIVVKGARVNNLKGIDIAIPRGKLIVITGLSGSGKSSLAFDTLFAEGQRMYVESLSAYARQFLDRMQKPEVEYIKGVSPAIAIEQKVSSHNPRSTVGTSTEVYDYLKLLFARIGKTYSPVSGQEVKKDTIESVIDFIKTFSEGERFSVLAPLKAADRTLENELKILLQKGYTRIVYENEFHFIEEALEKFKKKFLYDTEWQDLFILIDRNQVEHENEDAFFRIADSVQTAFFEGHGECIIDVVDKGEHYTFSDRFELDGITFEEPSVNFFSFNKPLGACKRCEGFGKIIGIDHDLVVPNQELSVYEGAIAPWRTEKMSEWQKQFVKSAALYDFPIHRSYKYLTEEEKKFLWEGNKKVKGIDQFFDYLHNEAHKIQYRVLLSRYRGRTTCPECRGTRLRKDASYVKVSGKSIQDIVLMPIQESLKFFKNINLSDHERQIARRILTEIENRLAYIEQVGLGYLTLNRLSSTLSGGESQRIKLSTALGSALVGSMYILDEPSIGLHPRDTQKLIEVLEKLKEMGNTVIVVEHEEEMMRAADQIIDIGPEAGAHGGKLIFQGNIEEFDETLHKDSHTLKFLNGTDQIEVPTIRRPWKDYIHLKGARENNLKNIDVKFPLGVLVTVTGVSGSGKSTLVKKILYPALGKLYNNYSGDFTGRFDSLEGDTNLLSGIEFIDQNPIGKSSRSNPVTYTKAYDVIRELYANQALSKTRGYKAGTFSFNIDGGRCETCLGEGEITIEMQFMADLRLPCETCKGKRFKETVLEIEYMGKNIAEILNLTVDEAVEFFEKESRIAEKLIPLKEVGLGYIKLGQSSNTLSGGEAQRIKLASFLDKNSAKHGKKMFVFDEPTTGLHFHDIKKLLKALQALVEQGHTVLIIEHNIEIIKSADWVIDIGPEGGEQGGYVNFAGTPEQLAQQKNNYTASFLKEKLNR